MGREREGLGGCVTGGHYGLSKPEDRTDPTEEDNRTEKELTES